MNRIISLAMIAVFALMMFCGCSGNDAVEENMDNMSENASVSDGDGVIGNENNNHSNGDNKTPTLEMPSVTMPDVTAERTTENQSESENSTGILDNVL